MNGDGIKTSYSTKIVIENNIIALHGGVAVYMSFSGNSSIINNTVIDNAFGGITAGYSSNLTIVRNTVDIDLHFCTYGIALWSCTDSYIINNNLIKNNHGIYLDDSHNNSVFGNIINDSVEGYGCFHLMVIFMKRIFSQTTCIVSICQLPT